MSVTLHLPFTSPHMVVIAFLPYDRDALLQTLQANPWPYLERATEATLDSFARRIHAYLAADSAWRRMTDSVTALAAALDSLARSSPTYGRAFARFRSVARQARSLDAARTRAYSGLEDARRTLEPAVQEAQDSLAHWAERAEPRYRETAARAALAARRHAVLDTIPADGQVRRSLPPGRWWIYARLADLLNPYAELYWNVPIVTQAGPEVTVELSERNARRRIRYAP